MKFISRICSFLLLLVAMTLSPIHLRAQPQTEGVVSVAASGLGDIKVKGAHVAEVDSTHARIAVDLAAIPGRTVTLESLRLTSLRLNGLPVYADPLDQPFELIQGKETALPPMYITAQFRDLTTVAPLRQMIETQTVHVQGQVVAAIKMSFLEKLALHTQNPHVLLPLAQDVHVAFGASPLARQAALGVLTVIEFGMKNSAVVRKDLPGLESSWARDLAVQANTNLLQIQTRYELKERDSSYPMVFDQLGFRLASGIVIATAEIKTPWEYDPEFLTRIKSGDAKLAKDTVEIQLRSCGKLANGRDANADGADDAPLLLSRHSFTLDVRGNADKDLLIVQQNQKKRPDKPGDFARINVRRRASAASLSVIVLAAPSAGGFAPASAVITQKDSWDKVAVYRIVPESRSGKASIEVVELSARRDGQAIHLNRPVDPSFYGSPILVPEGVLGIVQDEETGAFLPTDLMTVAAITPSAQ